jgi:uncharacterized membrane protein YhaH (DUF805 family)
MEAAAGECACLLSETPSAFPYPDRHERSIDMRRATIQQGRTAMDFYLSGNGRVSIGQYWLRWVLPVLALMIVAFAALYALGLMNMDAYLETGQYPTGMLVLFGVSVLLIWPSFAVGAKRLHDIGWNGWLMLLSLVPIASLVITIVTLFIPGNRGDNKYGPQVGGS